jgi:3D (Asp-Asp-Asp) domain-containing protein
MLRRNMRPFRTYALLVTLALVALGCRGIHPPGRGQPAVRRLVVTGYCKCGECCGWRRTWYGRAVCAAGPNKGKRKVVGMTASGSMAKPGTIAADTTRYPFGTVMYIEGYGYGRVEDRGADIKGDHIDLFFRTHREAKAWGRDEMRVMIWTAD